jgi:hypothetical protein
MWPWGVWEVKAPGFLDNWHIKVVTLSALRTGRLYPQEYPGTHFRKAESTLGTWTCRMPRKKSPVTWPGIDPGTFRLVAQHLNHYATPGPSDIYLPLTLVQNVTTLCSWSWYYFSLYMPLTLLQNLTTVWPWHWCYLRPYIPLTLLQKVNKLWSCIYHLQQYTLQY